MMTTQTTMFDTAGEPEPAAFVKERMAKRTAPKEDRKRLTGNRLRVLERLRQGPATNAELCQPSVGGMRFGARIHELIKDGYDIETSRRDGGAFVYELKGEPAE